MGAGKTLVDANLRHYPFCGGRVEMVKWKYNHNLNGYVYEATCLGCGMKMPCGYHESDEEAVAVWNKLEGRTCRAIPNREWVKNPECGVDCHTCSECGKVLYYDWFDCPRYCPNCGAKVVEE